MMGYGSGGGAGMWLFGLVTLVGVVLLGILAIRLFGGGLGPNRPAASEAAGITGPRRDPALAILDQRYARGEIDTEEYQERVRQLGGGKA